jgi:hypothetical protein
LKGKILFASMIVALAILAFAPAANAYTTIVVSGYCDKTNYKPGDTVTMTIYLRQAGTDTIVFANATVAYPWYNILWGGNQTVDAPSTAIVPGKNWNFTVTFTIPTDGRAHGGYVTIDYYYTIAGAPIVYHGSDSSVYLQVTTVPYYFTFENMDNLITIITVETVLIIISAIIIAAAIFLSTRRPKVTWTAEQKE